MRNYYVEPGTVIMLAQAAYKLWGAANKEKELKKIVALLKEINGKLDTIIHKQDQILAELREMRIQFKLDLRNEFINALQVDLAAFQSEINVEAGQIGAISNREALMDLAKIAKDLRHLSFRFLGYGLPALTGTMASALLLATIYSLMRQLGANLRSVNSEELSFLEEWDNRLAQWFDPNQQEGIAFALNLITTERQALQDKIDAHPRRVSLGYFRTGEEHYSHSRNATCKIHQERILVISGDLNSGFSDTYELGAIDRYRECVRDRPNLHGPAVGAVGELLPAFEPKELRSYSVDLYDPERPFDLPFEDDIQPIADRSNSYYENAGKLAFGSSGVSAPVNHAITVALNKQRDVWISVLEHETQLSSLNKILGALREALKGRRTELA